MTASETSFAYSTSVAEKLSGDGMSVIYNFRLGCGDRELLRGRAAVMLDADKA